MDVLTRPCPLCADTGIIRVFFTRDGRVPTVFEGGYDTYCPCEDDRRQRFAREMRR